MALALTETWWDGRVCDAEVNVPGYSLYRSDRETRGGGGSALFINNSLTVTEDFSWGDDNNNVVAVYLSNSHTVIGSIYRTGEYQYTVGQNAIFSGNRKKFDFAKNFHVDRKLIKLYYATNEAEKF